MALTHTRYCYNTQTPNTNSGVGRLFPRNINTYPLKFLVFFRECVLCLVLSKLLGESSGLMQFASL